jgi:hypothetical protein
MSDRKYDGLILGTVMKERRQKEIQKETNKERKSSPGSEIRSRDLTCRKPTCS